MPGLKQFRYIPANLVEWSKWMRDQEIEEDLGKPDTDGEVLISDTDGNRSWQSFDDLNFGPTRFYLPTAETAFIEDINSSVNTGGNKQEGQVIFNIDTNKPIFAAGPSDTDVWLDATGATAHTPS